MAFKPVTELLDVPVDVIVVEPVVEPVGPLVGNIVEPPAPPVDETTEPIVIPTIDPQEAGEGNSEEGMENGGNRFQYSQFIAGQVKCPGGS